MNKIFEMVKVMDLFGVPVKILTDKAEEKFSSIYGGLISIIIYTSSLIYFIYMMNLWGSGKIQPNISLSQKTVDYAEFEWNQTLIYFTSQDSTSEIDPFSRTNNIFTPLLFSVVNYKIFEKPQLLFSDPQNPSQVNIKNGSVVLNNLRVVDESHQAFKVYLLVFAICREEYMDENSSCASSEVIEKYLSEFHGFFSINLNLQQFNYNTNQFETITKTIYQALSPTYPQFTQMSIKLQQARVDDGVLLENNKYYQSVNNFEIINQSIDKSYASNIINSMTTEHYEIDAIIACQMIIDSISIQQHIQLPKLNTILAQIGSIVQVIFFLKYLAFYINTKMNNEELFHQIVMMYYPSLKNIIINRNIIGKVVTAQYQNKQEQLNSQFKLQYQQLLDVAKQKCRLTNILYEISRLQFLLEQYQGYSSLLASHDLGAKINFIQEPGLDISNRASIIPSELLEQQEFSAMIKLLIKKYE